MSVFAYIKQHGFVKGCLSWYGTSSRLFIIKYFPKVADKIVAKRKGKCNQCGACCPSYCEYLKDNKCTIQGEKLLLYKQGVKPGNGKISLAGCYYCPFPFELKWGNPKWKNCGFYYGNKK